MIDTAASGVGAPSVRPADPRFSSGPCRKHPGWNLQSLATDTLGRSHRATEPKLRLKQAIDRTATLVDLPHDWQLGIVPGSDTGAFEMAMWSLLGQRPVNALVWDSFSSDWAQDLAALSLPKLQVHKADAGELPTLSGLDKDHDLVFVYNGTTTGTRLPNLNQLPAKGHGLRLCDATSAAFAMPLDFSQLDVVTWSWQKCLGGEAAHGMLALGPRAVTRLEQNSPRALPKLFTLTKQGKLIDGIFSGATINTPSMLAVEDYHSALDWAESIGGLDALIARCTANQSALGRWVADRDWVEWLPTSESTRSPTSMCLKVVHPVFTGLPSDEQQPAINAMVKRLADKQVAYDIANYRSAPPGFRIWGGPTIEQQDIEDLTPWLDWTFKQFLNEHNTTSQLTTNGATSHG